MSTNESLLQRFGSDPFDRVRNSLDYLKQGKGVIVVDDEKRENEGDIIFAAEKITPENINFLIRTCTGIICLCLTKECVEKLDLEMMVAESRNTCRFGTPFTVSIDAMTGVTTGVSAADRAVTVLKAIDEKTLPGDLARPGHIFPLCAKDGGVIERPGHTEGSIDLVRLAGLKPAAVLCELMNPDGTMARLPEIVKFSTEHRLTVVSIEDIVLYRKKYEV